jgi:hypothetical protein
MYLGTFDIALQRILTFQKEKLKEVAMKLTNPFWKDVLSSYHFAKPYTKMNTNELLSLDILNFVPVKIIGIQFISSLFKCIKITRMWVNKIT